MSEARSISEDAAGERVFEQTEPGTVDSPASGATGSGLPPPTFEPVSPRKLRLATLPRHGAVSRGLVLAWCLWLLGSWAVTLYLDSAVAGIRLMIFSCLIGMMALWPAFRLSLGGHEPWHWAGASDTADDKASRDAVPHRATPSLRRKLLRHVGAIFVDWLSLNLVFQAVIWPLRITAGWSMTQTLWLDAAVAAWSLLTAAVLAWVGPGTRAGGRAAAMALCMLLLLAEPAAQALMMTLTAAQATWTLRGPLNTIWHLAGPSLDFDPRGWSATVNSIFVAAAMMWIIALVRILLHRPHPPHGPPSDRGSRQTAARQ